MRALGELAATLWDSLRCGELGAHLRAWWSVATGKVTPDTRGDWAIGNE